MAHDFSCTHQERQMRMDWTITFVHHHGISKKRHPLAGNRMYWPMRPLYTIVAGKQERCCYVISFRSILLAIDHMKLKQPTSTAFRATPPCSQSEGLISEKTHGPPCARPVCTTVRAFKESRCFTPGLSQRRFSFKTVHHHRWLPSYPPPRERLHPTKNPARTYRP